ncbi:unnamed protein product [Angiostrongylus costaricensis]|uniref:Dirigent protein n=1 Tax=Angiostrongylus costaricensis TaxID=334426 RepID=A0A0R3PMH2_ANGCS|nr:unnamed protein product [Angiostrongylus costaricensis]
MGLKGTIYVKVDGWITVSGSDFNAIAERSGSFEGAWFKHRRTCSTFLGSVSLAPIFDILAEGNEILVLTMYHCLNGRYRRSGVMVEVRRLSSNSSQVRDGVQLARRDVWADEMSASCFSFRGTG